MLRSGRRAVPCRAGETKSEKALSKQTVCLGLHGPSIPTCLTRPFFSFPRTAHHRLTSTAGLLHAPSRGSGPERILWIGTESGPYPDTKPRSARSGPNAHLWPAGFWKKKKIYALQGAGCSLEHVVLAGRSLCVNQSPAPSLSHPGQRYTHPQACGRQGVVNTSRLAPILTCCCSHGDHRGALHRRQPHPPGDPATSSSSSFFCHGAPLSP